MLCSIGHGEIPNLNFWLAPSCGCIGTIPSRKQEEKYPTFNNNSYAYNHLVNLFYIIKHEVIIPKKVEVKIIENNIEQWEETVEISKEKSHKKIFDISNSEASHDTYSDLSTHDHSVDLNFITENDIIKFNNEEKLKKIHSVYHIKRKIMTKFQNEIRVYANNLIVECNKNIPNVKIPILTPFSKTFREDVKIDTFKKIKNCLIEKYIKEDIQSAGRSLNINNSKVVELIKDIYEKYGDNNCVKKLNSFLFKTIVIDYYNEFFESEDFKSYLEKDLKKYVEKLKLLNYPEEKIQLYKKIFKEKYEGIAKYLFYTD